MARSIHDTWGVLERAQRADWSDPKIPQAIEAEMTKNWLRQQAIRESERRLRRGGALPPQPVHPDHVPIFIDEAPYVFHPAGEEDVRAVLHRLPPGSLDGLQAIRLCVDHSNARREPRVRDPFTGRLRHELIPGVFVSSTAGDYDRQTAIIRLFAFLCDPATLGPIALYLKMDVLRTLVHEAAHHFDATFRKKRSRWDLRDKNELWAKRIEAEQASQIVASYVGERYSSECRELRSWIKDHGGAALSPLVLLRDDDDLHCTSRDAFLALVRAVLGGRDHDEARIEFARDLHRSGENDGARQAVKRVLTKRPDAPAALAVSACISQCAEEDYKTAEALCRRAIASDPMCLDAWNVLARCYVIQKRWQDAAPTCEGALSRARAGDEGSWYFVKTLAESHLHLGDWSAVDSDVARMRAWGTEHGVRCSDVYLAIARCWSERWEEALLLASRLLLAGEYEPWQLWLAAVRFESAHRLGRPHQGGAFHSADMIELEGSEFAKAWARRIREHIEMDAR
ncbi:MULTISPECIES: tetratricopeptide repeat protein [Sorangium]|uniref:Tetratricopeptide repeat protein n=1 Tax=Sorangium cellulosum (strain So ce56) TaxID=448385 RepID=A9GJN1_SORC5|nr:tetratricopeptide repeat protein [Sorangium cellulosum]CAN96466.1 hypothetical protein predicted by Glimmer/Critica [Sorangium cellulosum So ce56]